MTLKTILSNNTFGWAIRGSQLLFTFINLVLIAVVLDRYSTAGEAGFAMFTTLVTFIYLIGAASLSFYSPGTLIIGVLLVLESFIALLWFIAFIAWAALFGDNSCSYAYNFYTYSFSGSSNACRAAKAVIAFGLFDFLLFSASAVILGVEVARPVIRDSTGSALWKSGAINGYTLNKPLLALTGLVTAPKASVETPADEPVVAERRSDDETVIPSAYEKKEDVEPAAAQ
jgi:hypothetical protein